MKASGPKPSLYKLTPNGPAKTLQQLSADYGLPYSTVFKRLRRGLSLHQALNTPTVATITAGGKTLTTKEWAAQSGLTVWCIRQRLTNGMSPQLAVTRPIKPPKIYSYKGQHLTAKAIAHIAGVTVGQVHARAVDGIVPDNLGRSGHYITANGQTLKIAQWAKITGVSAHRIYKRIYKGVDPAIAVTTPLNAFPPRAKLHPFNGQMMTAKAIAASIGCNTSSVYIGLRDGKDLTTIKPRKSKTKPAKGGYPQTFSGDPLTGGGTPQSDSAEKTGGAAL